MDQRHKCKYQTTKLVVHNIERSLDDHVYDSDFLDTTPRHDPRNNPIVELHSN